MFVLADLIETGEQFLGQGDEIIDGGECWLAGSALLQGNLHHKVLHDCSLS